MNDAHINVATPSSSGLRSRQQHSSDINLTLEAFYEQREMKMREEHKAEMERMTEELHKCHYALQQVSSNIKAYEERMAEQENAVAIEKQAMFAEQKERETQMNLASEIIEKELRESLDKAKITIEETKHETKKGMREVNAELQSEIGGKVQVIHELETKITQSREQGEVLRNGLLENLEKSVHSNADLKAQLKVLQTNCALELRLELAEKRDANQKLEYLLQQVKEELKGSQLDFSNRLNEQRNITESLAAELKHVQKQIDVSRAESMALDGQKRINFDLEAELKLAQKQCELEEAKKELAETKLAFKNKNGTFAKQLQTTEHELQELSCMKETLLATMNDLAEKNSIITKELEDAKEQLAFLEEQALSVSHLKLWSTLAVIAVFMGNFAKTWLMRLKSNEVDQPPSLEGIALESEYEEFEPYPG